VHHVRELCDEVFGANNFVAIIQFEKNSGQTTSLISVDVDFIVWYSKKFVFSSANIEELTIHGLRRSFSLLGEAAGAPAGAIAQVMGHKPSATAEGYRPRSIDALRPFLEQIESYILERAGVTFDASIQPGKLRVVAR